MSPMLIFSKYLGLAYSFRDNFPTNRSSELYFMG